LSVTGFTAAHGKIVAIDVLSDPKRVAALDLVVFDDSPKVRRLKRSLTLRARLAVCALRALDEAGWCCRAAGEVDVDGQTRLSSCWRGG
jgi:hypothetical protein